MAAKEQKKLITTPTLVLMIISTIYGFGNVSIAYDQMAYAGMFWYILAGVCFFFPCCLMMAEYGSAFKDAQGGIYSWLAGSIGERLAFYRNLYLVSELGSVASIKCISTLDNIVGTIIWP